MEAQSDGWAFFLDWRRNRMQIKFESDWLIVGMIAVGLLACLTGGLWKKTKNESLAEVTVFLAAVMAGLVLGWLLVR